MHIVKKSTIYIANMADLELDYSLINFTPFEIEINKFCDWYNQYFQIIKNSNE